MNVERCSRRHLQYNPDSVRVAIDVLYPAARVLVLGDAVCEIRDSSPALHAEVGNYAREQEATR